METTQDNNGGRPTKYKASFNNQAYKLCLLGATDRELADFFEVNIDTIHQWKKDHPGFSDSLKKGKIQADSVVAEKLYQKAIGYSCTETDIRVINDKVEKTKFVKRYPPDTTAAIFWLKNRQKASWRDKQQVDFDFENFPEHVIEKITDRLIAEAKKNSR